MEWLLLFNVLFLLMIFKVVVYDGFIFKNLLFEILLVFEFELFGEDESCLDWVVIELVGGNCSCVFFLFDVFIMGKFLFLFVIDVCFGVIFFIFVVCDLYGE